MPESKNIVIVGASVAGHGLAKLLAQDTKLIAEFRILLIDPAAVAYWPISSLRACVVPGWEKKCYQELKEEEVFAPGTKHIKAKVVQVAADHVVLDREFEGSTIVPFAAMALATGASQPFPMRPKQEWSVSEVEAHLTQTQKDIASAESVVIIGGGPTGIEMAGEIFSQHPTKKITLIHRQPRLLDDRFPKKLSNQLEDLLKKANVELVLGDEHIQEPDLVTGKQNGMRTIKTKNGKQIQADFVFIAIGNSPNTQIMADADPAALSKARTINVNDYLQVTSSVFPNKNVFAAGDCANSPGWRSAISAGADAATIAKNIPALLRGAPLKKHAPGMRAMLVPTGPSTGAGFLGVPLLGDTAFPQFMVSKAKGKDLLTDKFYERFNTV